MIALVTIIVLLALSELIYYFVWTGKFNNMKKRRELKEKGIISLDELITIHPPETYFKKVHVYRKFIEYAQKTFGNKCSNIFMSASLFVKLVNFMTDCGYSSWIDWLNFRIQTEKINLKDTWIEFRINEEGYGLIDKIWLKRRVLITTLLFAWSILIKAVLLQ